MIGVAEEYINNSTWLNSYHIDDPYGQCPTRFKPHYLTQPGTYMSELFDWGGGDSPSQFRGYMLQDGKFAGDLPSDTPWTAERCSRGVDCAGFVSNAWGIARQGTWNLYNTQSEALLDGWGAMQPGDVAIREPSGEDPGRVILYHHTEAYGMYCYESTTSGDLDRVVWTYSNRYWMSAATFPGVSSTLLSSRTYLCSHWARPEIEFLKRNQYLAGCWLTPPRYCPSNSVPRKEMAVFVLRGAHGGDYQPPEATGQIFQDVPMGHPYIDWINQMYLEGYTAGCWANPLRFCPDNIHTRAESTVYMLHVKFGPTYMPPTPTVKPFADVELNTWYAKWVAAAKTYGLTRECGPNLFCPNDPLLCDVGAWMLYRAKD